MQLRMKPGAWRLVGALALTLSFCPAVAEAQSVRQIGSFRDWSAYSAAEGTGHICFAVAKAAEVTPQPDGYTQAYLYLTRRPAENVSNELNLVAGFPLDPDQPATLNVAGQLFNLFARDDSAWLQDTSQTETLAGVMRAGTTAVIDVTTDQGVKVEETFSLAGATAASRALTAGC